MPQIETDGQDQTTFMTPGAREWDEVLRFWFPDSLEEDVGTHGRHWAWRMRGEADEEIVARFADLTEQASSGVLDHWASDPKAVLP